MSMNLLSAFCKTSNASRLAHHRYFSSPSGRFAVNRKGLIAYPRYTVVGSDGASFSLAPILPTLTTKRNTLNMVKTGKFFMEWRRNDYDNAAKESFVLSLEEAMVLTTHLPNEAVEFSRPASQSPSESSFDKVVRFEPSVAGSVEFAFEYHQDGVVAQPQAFSDIEDTTIHNTNTWQVQVQRGEVIVIQQLLQHSISRLTSWDPMVDIATHLRMGDASRQ